MNPIIYRLIALTLGLFWCILTVSLIIPLGYWVLTGKDWFIIMDNGWIDKAFNGGTKDENLF